LRSPAISHAEYFSEREGSNWDKVSGSYSVYGEPVSDVDYSAVDADLANDQPEPEQTVTLGRIMSAAFSLVFRVDTEAKDMTLAGARAHSLMTLLDPINSKFPNLSEIARVAQCTRSCLSLQLMRFRYDVGLKIGLKRNSIHDRSYRSLPQAGVKARPGWCQRPER
jgi:hypothetical protein